MSSGDLPRLGMLQVGGITWSADEVEDDVSALSEYLQATWPPANGSRYFPVLMDNSMDSHLVLLAMGRLRMNCAFLDSGVPVGTVAGYLDQIGETEAHRPSDLLSAARFTAQQEGVGCRSQISRGESDHAWPQNDGSFVIFTSGSAGRPNGVAFRWGQAFDIIFGSLRPSSLPIDQAVVLNLQPLHWTVGLFHVLRASMGHPVATLDPLSMSASQLLREISRLSPTTIYLGADLARVLGKAMAQYEGDVVPTVSRFAVGAGTLRWEDLLPYRKLIPPNAEFVHSYGASEAVGMMAYSCRFGDTPLSGQVPVGQPLTEGGIRLVVTGEPTLFEVYASARIASRYLDPVLTDQRFVEDEDGTIWWRSGDQVRLDPETNEFYFHGRLDDLTKISDKRVSLVEIEMALRGHPSVTDAVVRVVAVGKRDRIIAFIQPIPGQSLAQPEVMAFLEDRLTEGIRPYLVLPLSQIPYTSRHKPDSEKLRAVVAEALAQ